MRTLNRNKQDIHYALYKEVAMVKEDGIYTGEKQLTYYAPVKIAVNVSASRGTSDVDIFGINTPYTRTIVTDDMNCPIKTDTVLWIGITPDASGQQGNIKANYKVLSVAKSLNSITYAVKEVDVS